MSQVTITVATQDLDVLLFAVQRQIEDIRTLERTEPDIYALYPAEAEKLDRLLSLSVMLMATRQQ